MMFTINIHRQMLVAHLLFHLTRCSVISLHVHIVIEENTEKQGETQPSKL